jgi:hypothetical protein
METIMRNVLQLGAGTTLALFLFACGIWANLDAHSRPELRGAWLAQTIR